MNNLPTELNMLIANILTCRKLADLSLASMDWYHITKVISLRRTDCLHIKRFNPANMKINSSALIAGRVAEGKTTLINDLLSHKKSLTEGIYLKSSDGFDYLGENKLKNFYDKRTKNNNYNIYSKTLPVACHTTSLAPAYCVVDDIYPYVPNIKTILENVRNINVFALLSTQYVVNYNPTIRRLFRYIFIFRRSTHEDLYYRLYIDHTFLSRDVFNRLLMSCTRNYGCLWEHTNTHGCLVIDIDDCCVFWYEADINIPKQIQIPPMIKEVDTSKYAFNLNETFNKLHHS